ncbi:Serine/threonineprotein kinase [Acanthamoeba castellanii str. Neff]|uniref:non-specific serine/threonine protein kinase n=1 Tax=Acanthamoeba castellanii (strain ATCC 30010 / Neff) TaxID=1257118 RepID=L8GZU5_ACACF|nr:Serine/threonineprotein kinase [Acanthamoeba castellanii str. Neff]ELR18497.1 Serine/threonineprotein kinase [Acanthamoeba castellanii str. Neff]
MLINRLLKRQKGAGGQEADATLAALDPWVVLYDDLVFGRQIGKGNFGRVFEGTYFGTPVAIKHLFPVGEGLSVEQTRKYVDREIVLLKSLHHPHIVQLIGICDHDSGQYIITELVTGGDLKTALARRDSVLSWRQRVVLARDVAYAMNFLHHKGYIHRDLKPDNVLITEHGRAKVCDLGFARASKKASSYMTIAGSDDYMAPEVLMGDKYDEKCDVFGYGAVLAGIVSRRRPKRNEDGLYGFKLDQFKALIPPECPKKLSDLVLQCCDYDGTKRPSFDQILSTLTKLLDKELKHEPDAAAGDPETKADATTNELRPSLKMLMRSQPQRSMNLASPPMSPVSTSSAPTTPLQQQKLMKMHGMRSMAKDAGLWNQFQSADSLSPAKSGGNSSKLQSQSLSTTSASVASVDSRCSVAPGSGGGVNRERSGSDKSIESSPRNRGLGADLNHRQRSSSEKAIDTTNSGGGGSSGSSSGGGESAMESSGCSSGGVGRRSARSGLQSLWNLGNTGTGTGSDRSMGWTDSERSISSDTSGLSSAGDKSETDDSERERSSSSKRAKRDKKSKAGKTSKGSKAKVTTAVGGGGGGGSGVHSARLLSTKEMMTWIGTSSNNIATRSATGVAEPSEATVEGEEEEKEKTKETTKEKEEKKKKDASVDSDGGQHHHHHLRPPAVKQGEGEAKERKRSRRRHCYLLVVRKSEAEASPASPAPTTRTLTTPGDIDAKPQWVIVEPHHHAAGDRERRKDLTALALTSATAGAAAYKQRPQSARRAAEPVDRRSAIVIGRTTATTSRSGGGDDVSSVVKVTSGGGSEATQRSLSRRSLSPRVMARMVEREEWEGGNDLSSDEMDSVIAQYVACPNSYAFGASTMQFFGNLKKGGRVQTLISLFQESEQAATATATAGATNEQAGTEAGHTAAAAAGDDAGGTGQEVSSTEKRRRQESSEQQQASAKESGDEESAATPATERDSQPPPRGKDRKEDVAAVPATPFE